MKKVDTHAHIFSADAPTVADARYRPSYTASVESYIHHLDLHNFNYGVLIQPSFLGYDNSQMLTAIAAYPARLKGIAVVPVNIQDAVLDELHAQNIVGVRLNLFGKDIPDLSQANWRSFLAKLENRNWQLELHCPPAYLRHLMPALEKYSSAIVLDHFGRIDPEKGVNDPDYQAILNQLDPDRYWIKVSGYYRLGQPDQALIHTQQALKLLLEHGLNDRLVWGSDWPHTQHESQISYDNSVHFLHNLIKDNALRDQILSKNALALYRFTS